MKNKLIQGLCALVFITGTTWVNAQEVSANASCPNPKLIKKVKFDAVQKGDTSGVWTLVQDNQEYKTNHHWKFTLTVEAENEAEALKKANSALANLKKVKGPEKVDTSLVCDYKSKHAMSAVAVAEVKSKS